MSNFNIPKSDCLKNKLGATRHSELQDMEGDFVSARSMELRLKVTQQGPTGNFDAQHLKSIHKHLFQDVYEFAGVFRTEPFKFRDGTIASAPYLRKVSKDSQPFAIGRAVEAGLEDLAINLRKDNFLKNLSRENFVDKAADYFSQLNSIHPFREGNGRTQRALFSQLAAQAGQYLDWRPVTQARMSVVSIAAHESDNRDGFRRLFNEITDPGRVQLLMEAKNNLEKIPSFTAKNVQALYIATLEPNEKHSVTFIHATGKQFMSAAKNIEGSVAVMFGKASDLPNPHPKQNDKITVTATAYTQPSTQKAVVKDGVPNHLKDHLQATKKEPIIQSADSQKTDSQRPKPQR